MEQIVIVFTAINNNTANDNIVRWLVKIKYNKPDQKVIHKEQSTK